MLRQITDLLVFWTILLLTLLSPALLAGVIATIAARCHMLKSSSMLRNGLLIGAATAVIRVPLVWIGSNGFHQDDWRQRIGFALTIFNSSVEILFARKWRNDLWLWPTLLSGLVMVTSILLGLLFAVLVRLMRSRAGSEIIRPTAV